MPNLQSAAVKARPVMDETHLGSELPSLSAVPCWKALSKDWDVVLPKHNRRLRSISSAPTNFWSDIFKMRNTHLRLAETLARDKRRIIELIYIDNGADEHDFDDLMAMVDGNLLWRLTPIGEALLSFAAARFERWSELLETSWKEALLIGSRTIRAADADRSSR